LLGNIIKKKILVIDDEESISITLQYRIQKEGFDCDLALSGKEGIEKLDENSCSYGLVITDLMMYPLTAIHIIKKVREVNSLIDVIIITGLRGSPLLDEAMELHPCIQFFKPFPSEELMREVRKCLEGASKSL
jgi:two-component system, response regulator, stage 0 sporulation protein F